MMGTGEASGDKRAIQAAEAAIANPLLDDVSMKGARGLLISITGGNDLTLYEVDEAATRIREEVDQDANIILGATFDESLDGTIRVSVVATGIDQEADAIVSSPAEQRLAALAERLQTTTPSPSTAARPQPQHVPAQQPAPAPVQHQPVEQAPIAAQEDVTLRPLAPRPTLTEEAFSAALEAEDDVRMEEPFIPPMPERTVLRPARLPQIEDLPVPVQNQIRQSRGEVAADAHAPEKKRMGLLQRLASVGLGRHSDEEGYEGEMHAAPQPIQPAPLEQAPAPRPDLAAEYARRQPASQPQPTPRAAQGHLDPNGRPAPRPASLDDDQLEIPAFLRRQAN
jgi:cell division protein FtsZ